MADDDTEDKYEYFDHDNAYYRRVKDEYGGFGGVNDVLVDGEWIPYKGNATAPHWYGTVIEDPTKTG